MVVLTRSEHSRPPIYLVAMTKGDAVDAHVLERTRDWGAGKVIITIILRVEI
jgi:hypothetical protein